MDEREYTYDVAVSFAGEQRPYVEKFVRACEELGLRTFYDQDKTTELWGQNVILALRRTYGSGQPRFFVPFISAEYLAKPYPMDELAAATEQSMRRTGVYILPVRYGDVDIPPEYLNPAIIYLRADDHTPAELANRLAAKFNELRAETAAPLRSPRIAPTSFNPRATLESVLAAVGKRFRQSAAAALEDYGYACDVTQDERSVDIQVTQAGQPVYGLSLWFDEGGMFGGRDRLSLSFAWPRRTGQGVNGWVSAVWDKATGSPAVELVEFGSGGHDRTLTTDELVDALWEKIMTYIEQRTR